MAQRYTRKDAETCFNRLVEDIGGRKAKSATDVGGLRLDYAPVYGGVSIEEISNAAGGVTQPFGSRRLKPAEFCLAVGMTQDAIRYRKSKGLSGARSGARRRRRK